MKESNEIPSSLDGFAAFIFEAVFLSPFVFAVTAAAVCCKREGRAPAAFIVLPVAGTTLLPEVDVDVVAAPVVAVALVTSFAAAIVAAETPPAAASNEGVVDTGPPGPAEPRT